MIEGVEEGAVIAGYRLVRLLGKGGSAVVWEALRVSTGERVALKIATGHASGYRRFLREAKAATALAHPNIVRVIEIREHSDGTPILALEYLVGETLRDKLKREVTLSLGETANLFLPVVGALRAAHDRGLVHRDLKPANLFLEDLPGKKPRPVVLDFGIVKLTASEGPAQATQALTATNGLLGTPPYMSPEQVRSAKNVDARSDVWALGMILYQALSGVLLTAANNAERMVRNVLEKPFPPLSEAAPHVPRDFGGVVDRMLSRDPALRPSLPEIEEALSAIAETQEEEAEAKPDPRAATGPEPNAADPVKPQMDADGFLLPGTLFANRYRMVRRMAKGGMGAIYEAVHVDMDRACALKVMLPRTFESADMRERFKQETRIVGKIDHDHIVRVFDAGVDETTQMPFMVMELLRGEDLGNMVKRRGALPPSEVVTYLWETAQALDATHAESVVHRDLKPENLFLARRGEGPRAKSLIKVLDFGIAKILADAAEASRSTSTIGTPAYMAPEQFKGRGRVTPATDVFALGQIAYTLLVGKRYWAQEIADGGAFAVIEVMIRGKPESAAERARRDGVVLSPAFDAWFSRATEIDPQKRFQGAIEAAEALAEALEVALPARVSTTDLADSRAVRESGASLSGVAPEDAKAATGEVTTKTGTTTTGPVDAALSPSPRRRWAIAAVVLAVAAGAGTLGLILSQTNETSMVPEPAAAETTTRSPGTTLSPLVTPTPPIVTESASNPLPTTGSSSAPKLQASGSVPKLGPPPKTSGSATQPSVTPTTQTTTSPAPSTTYKLNPN